MTWHSIIKVKDHTIDIHAPSFPWRDGRPDWDRYHLIKRAEREERMKSKKRKAPEYARNNCQYIGAVRVCGAKAYGMLEVMHNGRKALVPLCEKHREECEARPVEALHPNQTGMV